MSDGNAIHEMELECSHKGCSSKITIASAYKVEVTEQNLYKMAATIGWLRRGWNAFCRGCRKAHE